MESFDIFLTGVGGQGIGLISEIVLRAADHAGLPVKGVDTHGLAQRGGIVVSRVRIGNKAKTPLIPTGEADMVIALERHEALRGMNNALKNKGTLVYYNTVQQPLETRLNQVGEVDEELVSKTCAAREINEYKVSAGELADARMQNIAVLATISKNKLIPGIKNEHYKQAMNDLLQGSVLEKNVKLFESL